MHVSQEIKHIVNLSCARQHREHLSGKSSKQKYLYYLFIYSLVLVYKGIQKPFIMDQVGVVMAWYFTSAKPTKLTSYQKKGFTFTVYDFMGWIVESDGYSIWPLHRNPVAW